MDLQLESAHGFPRATSCNGGKIICFGNGNYGFPCGTGVQFANVGNGQLDFWQPSSDKVHEVTHCVLNPKGTVLVVAERRLSVNLLIFGAADRRLLQRLPDVCKVVLKDCCFSRCGNYFATLAAGPTFQISVFAVDAATQKFHKISSTAAVSVPGSGGFHSYTNISFNPRDFTDIFTTGGGHASFWKLQRPPAGGSWSIANLEAKVTTSNVRLTVHAWTTSGMISLPAHAYGSGTFGSNTFSGSNSAGNYGSATFSLGQTQNFAASGGGVTSASVPPLMGGSSNVLVGTMSGEIYEFESSVRVGRLALDLMGLGEANPAPEVTEDEPDTTIPGQSHVEEAHEEKKRFTGNAITSILVTKHNVVVGTEDGTVRMCTMDLMVIKTIRLPIVYNPLQRASNLLVSGLAPVQAGLRSMTMTPEWNTILCGSGDGSVYMIHLPGYEQPTLGEMPSAKVAIVQGGSASSQHSIVGCVHLPSLQGVDGSGTSVATISTEGCLRIYNYATNTEVLKEYLPGAGPTVEPTSIDIGSGDTSKNVIVIGYSNGTVQFVTVQAGTANKGQGSVVAKVAFHEKVTRILSDEAKESTPLRESIRTVVFDPTGTLCAAATDQRSIVIFSIGGSTAFDVKAIININKAANGLDGPLTSMIKDVAWFPQGEFSIAVSLANSEVFMLSVPTDADLASHIAALSAEAESAASSPVRTASQSNLTATDGATDQTTTAGTLVTTTTVSNNSLTAAPGSQYSTNTAALEIPAEKVMVNSWRLAIPCHKILVGALFEDTFKLLGMSPDKETKIFNLNRTLPLDRKDRETKQVPSDESFPDHSKKGSLMLMARNGRLVITGGTDGKIVIRDVAAALQNAVTANNSGSQAATVARHVSVAGGVTGICISPDSMRLVSCGHDGVITVNTFGKGVATFQRGVYVAAEPVGEPAKEDAKTLYFADKRAIDRHELELVQHESYRANIRATIEKLSRRLSEIRAENAKCEPDEKVALIDFLVPQEKDRFGATTTQAIEKMRQDVRWENLRRDYLIDKLKRECVDVMETPLTKVKAMLVGPEAAKVLQAAAGKKKATQDAGQSALTPSADQSVHNLPYRKQDPNDLLILRKLKFLRLVEKKDRQIRQVHELQDIRAPPETDQAKSPQPGDGSNGNNDAYDRYDDPASPQGPESPLTPPSSPAGAGTTETHPPLAVKGRKLEDEACDDVEPFLYNPWLVFTKNRAIMQIRLLEGRAMHLKSQFNAEFSALQERKVEDRNKMEDRNNRAKVLIKELDEPHILFTPSIDPDEKPKELLTVHDEEVPADKSTDPTEKKRLAAVEMERQRWLERHGDDGSSDRALKVWMDGRLDKEIRVLEVKMDLPDFANEESEKFVAPDERTEDQHKILREFEKKLAKRKEEVEARRKLLQTEVAQIKQENLETAKAFDAAVQALFAKRLEVSRKCHEIELQQVKLVQSVVLHGHRQKLHRRVEQQRIELADKLVQATKVTSAQKQVLDAKQDQLKDLQADEKNKEKNMRQIQPFSDHEEYAELLYKLCLKRKPKKGKTGSDKRTEEKKQKLRLEAANEAQASPDPFAFVEKDEELRRKLQQAEEAIPLPRIERPADIPDPLWDAFQTFRQDRVDADRDIKRLNDEIAEALRENQQLQSEEDNARAQAEAAAQAAVRFAENSVRAMYDVDELHVFRQGLVEVKQEPVVTDYADAILIDSARIERLNQLIRASGSEKVGMMRAIGEKRKELRMFEWEIERLSYLMGTLEMEHSHLHTLRVTKQMQAFINGGGEDHNERERSKLLHKIEHVRTSMAAKIEERKRQMLQLRRANKEKEMENRVLQEQVGQAKEVVDERKAIHDLQSSELDKERTSKLMRDMRVTRKLEDVAKAQQEEMVQLKREIDKLRERTFPSFAVVSKRVVGNPDETY